jgi:hypothetical protein
MPAQPRDQEFRMRITDASHNVMTDGNEVIPNDDEFLLVATRALYVGKGGSLVVELTGSQSGTSGEYDPETPKRLYFNVQDGAVLPLAVRRVFTETDAAMIIALY